MLPPVTDERDVAERLRQIRALTDIALADLDVEAFLEAILDRVRDLLGADTAAVLLVEDASGDLVARAARGIEEEVRQGVRVPMAKGFAGRIAADRKPVVLDRVDATTVANPILWERGIKAMLGVPLVSGGRLVGVLHVGSLRPRTFTEGDVELLQIAADRVAGVTQTRLAMVEQAAAGIVQRSLLPTALPQIDGLEFAARYVAAGHGGVGGDWYDVFRLDSGDVWVVTGDVAGHGFRAAVVMARIRSAMRAFALDGNSPVDVIAKTDRKLAHFEPDDMATVACAVLRPPYDEVELAVAGHLPPVLALPGGPSVLVELDEVAPPIGAIGVLAPKATTVPFPVGAVLFFYTDGLVERRTEPLQTGLARLTAALTAGPPPAVCHAVMANLVGNYEADDDIAVIAMRRSGDG